MCTEPTASSPRLSRSRCIAIASMTLLLSACSTNPSRPPEKDLSLVRVACPDLTPLTDRTFGATARKLDAVANQYYECQAAALSLEPEKRK